MTTENKVAPARRRGAARQYPPRQDLHIPLSLELVARLDDAAGKEGRPALVERLLRTALDLPPLPSPD